MKMATTIEIPITARARTYGYIIWSRKQTVDMELFVGKNVTIDIETSDGLTKTKRVDRKQKRISLGYKFTRALEKRHTVFILTRLKPGRISLSTR